MAARPQSDLDLLFDAARIFIARHYPGRQTRKLKIQLDDGTWVALPVPFLQLTPGPDADQSEPFVSSPFQDAILDALEGKALRTDGLAGKVGDRSRLFRKPGGLHELQEQGLVKWHKRLGYYRPDAPPEELSDQS